MTTDYVVWVNIFTYRLSIRMNLTDRYFDDVFEVSSRQLHLYVSVFLKRKICVVIDVCLIYVSLKQPRCDVCIRQFFRLGVCVYLLSHAGACLITCPFVDLETFLLSHRPFSFPIDTPAHLLRYSSIVKKK